MTARLRYLCIALLILALPGASAQADDLADAQILHLLNRITFGPTPGDIEAVRRMGSLSAYIEKQLHPEDIAMPAALQNRLEQLPALNASMAWLAAQYQKPGEEKLSDGQKMMLNQARNEVVQQLMEAKILRAIMSPAQLQEVMTDFWFNHFNVFAEKGFDKIFIGSYERDAIRPYALGHFRDLLQATAHHPAMLFYLDNWQNTAPDSVLARKAAVRGKDLGINENYARELMELHTLGVDGGYTQQDVTTLAHILTGWGLGRGPDAADKAVFFFDPKRHDYNNEVLLGENVRGGGGEEIEAVLDFLARHPSTAHHISYELAQYFVADDPPESLVNKLTDTFERSDGDIAEVLRTLFRSSEFWDPQYEQAKFKPPFRYVISAMRASYVVPDGDTRVLQWAINSMGEPLYRCQTPNGYSNTKDEWLNSDSLLKRITIARQLNRVLADNSAQTIQSSLGNAWSANTLKAVDEARPELKAALLLSSPDFLYY